jgi:hypothetical protein
MDTSSHWWFSKGNGVWAPYSIEDSEQLEHAYVSGIDRIELRSGTYTVVISERAQFREGGSRRPILRGLWYYEASNGSLNPFPEDAANEIENHFSSVLGETTFALDQQRKIHRTSDGTHEQIRSDTGKVRRIVRGYSPFERQTANTVDSSWELATIGVHRRTPGTGAAVLELAQGYTQVIPCCISSQHLVANLSRSSARTRTTPPTSHASLAVAGSNFAPEQSERAFVMRRRRRRPCCCCCCCCCCSCRRRCTFAGV